MATITVGLGREWVSEHVAHGQAKNNGNVRSFAVQDI